MTAEDRAAYSSAHGLRLDDGSVLAVIELRTNGTLPTRFDVRIRTQYENLFEAYVPVCDLVPISRHRNVSFVRPPADLEPGEPTEEREH